MDVRVDGATLHVETVGDGAPCLCLHGGPGSDSSGLVATLGPLAAPLGVRMVFWDHRGHGRSEWVPAEQCTQDRLVADVEAVRHTLGLGPVRVLGISWGGFLGLMYAARYPASVTALAVVGAAPSHEFMERADANARAQAPRVSDLRLPGRARACHLPDVGRGRSPRLDLPRKPGRGDPQAHCALHAHRLRAQRTFAPGGRT